MTDPIAVFYLLGAFALGGCAAWLAMRSRVAGLTQLLRQSEGAAKERLEQAAQADQRLREAFAVASREALRENSGAFLDLARASMNEFQQAARSDLETRQHSIDRLIQPVSESLQRMGASLQVLDRDRATTAASLAEHMRHMAADQQKLVAETEALGRALRTPQVRGQWGEMQLHRAVELAGMLEHCDFEEQATVQTEDGRLRPDLVVHLPRGKSVVVDSKAPLSAYLDAVNATDESARGVLLKRHAAQVRTHVEMLASKDYSNQFVNSPDFVVMFLPGEAFFSAACSSDPSLLDYAVQLGVIPCSPTTLITLLKAVSYGWQQDRIAERAEQIRDLGAELHDRVRNFTEHFAKVRKGLEGAVGAYNSAVGSLESRVLPTARRMRELGPSAVEGIDVVEPVNLVPRLAAAEDRSAVDDWDTASPAVDSHHDSRAA